MVWDKSLFASGTPYISGNIIRGNSATGLSPCASGGGISMYNQADAAIVQNQITGNTASCGAGVYSLPSGRGPYLINNTITDNVGPGVETDDSAALLMNNLIVGGAGQNALFCGYSSDTPVSLQFNDIYSASASAYGGTCTDRTGTSGNISADPLFVSAAAQNYHLKLGSPAIAVGNIKAPNIPAVDFAGAARTQSGKVDMGLYEFTAALAADVAAFLPIDNGIRHSARIANAQSQSSGRFFNIDVNHHRTQYAYDTTGKMIVQTDPNGGRHK